MRKIGETPNETQAIRFCDYLTTRQIACQAEDAGKEGAWAVWVKNEDHLETARSEMADFLNAPDDAKYSVSKEAEEIRRQKQLENQQRLNQQRAVRGGSWGAGGGPSAKPKWTIGLIVLCVACFLFTDPGNERDIDRLPMAYRAMKFVDPMDYAQSNGNPLASIAKGQIWRVFTPNLLHGSALHLGMNMIWMFILGGVIERLQGPALMVLLVFITGTVAIVCQSLLPASLSGGPNVVGISGATFGLFAYLWIRPKIDPGFPSVLSPNVIFFMIVVTLASMLMPGLHIAHIAHIAGGLAGAGCAVVLGSGNSKG